MYSQYKYLLKNTSLLMIGNLGAKLVSFILIPIYTSILSTSDYGIFDILITTESLIIPIITLDIGDAIFRFSINNKHYTKVIGNGIIIWIVGSVLALPCTILFSKFISYHYCLYIYITYIFHSINTILINYIKAIDKIRLISLNGILNAFVFGITSILLLVVFPMGLKGYLIAYVIGFMIPDLFLIVSLRHNLKINIKLIDKTLIKQMLSYSIPLIFASIGWWVISASDRYMVSWIAGTDQNGIYSIAYKIPNILVSLMTLFSQAWVISVIKDTDARFHVKTYKIYYTSLVLCCIVLISCSELIGRFLYSNSFYPAWRIAPWLLIASVFQGISTFYCNILTGEKDSKGITYASISGSIINILLNFTFIPIFGGIGAAYATCVAYIIVWLSLHLRVYRKTAVKYFKCTEVILYCLLFLCTFSVLNNLIAGYMAGTISVAFVFFNNRTRILLELKKITRKF